MTVDEKIPNTMLDSKACSACRESLPDLLLSPEQASPAAREHLQACAICSAELSSLQQTISAMDIWTAPEPSPFFDTRVHARLREEIRSAPEGLFERLRSYFVFSTGRQLRPALAGALGLMLLLGGGTLATLHSFGTPHQPTASATVNDLRIMDNNAQALQQMDQLLDDNGDDAAPPMS